MAHLLVLADDPLNSTASAIIQICIRIPVVGIDEGVSNGKDLLARNLSPREVIQLTQGTT